MLTESDADHNSDKPKIKYGELVILGWVEHFRESVSLHLHHLPNVSVLFTVTMVTYRKVIEDVVAPNLYCTNVVNIMAWSDQSIT